MFGCIEKKFHTSLFLLSIFIFAGCTGLTLGENKPGDDTYLEGGAIAVDPQTENVYVLKRSTVWDEELAEEKGVNGKQLAVKVTSWTPGQTMAVLDACERYWFDPIGGKSLERALGR